MGPSEKSTADDEAYAVPEQRAELLIHLDALMDAVDADPRSVELQVAAIVALARRRNDPELLGLSLRVLGGVYRARWDESTARRMLDEAARVTRRHQAWYAEARVLASRASVLHEQGNVAGAERDLAAALVAMERAPGVDPHEKAKFFGRVGLSLAIVEQHSGRLSESEQRYRGLLSDGGLDVRAATMVFNNLAHVLADRGRYDEALRAAGDAVDLAAAQVPSLLPNTLQTRAWIAVRAGRLQEGMRDFDGSEQAFIAAGRPTGEFYAEYAEAMTDLRLLPEAALAATRAVEELQRAGLGLVLTEAQVRLAKIMLLSGRAHDARFLAEVAAADARKQRRTGWKDRAQLLGVEARLKSGEAGSAELGVARRAATRLERSGELHGAVEGYLVAGRVALGIDDLRAAAPTLTRARELARRGQVLVRLRGRVAGALAERAVHRDGATLAECRAGLRDLAVHRSALPTIELRALASGHGAELGEIGLGVVLAQGSAARTLAWMERTRAAALLVRLPASSAVLAERGPVRGRSDEVSPGRGASASAGPRPVRSAADWTRSGNGPWTERAVAGSAGVAALRTALAGRSLVEFGVFEDRLVAVVVDPRRARLVEIGSVAAVESELRPLLFALRRLANPRGADAAAAARASADLRIARLRALLVAPLGVGQYVELVVVPVGALHGVPWSCLHDGPLSLAPSATFWQRTAQAAAVWRGGTGTVLVAGPDLDGAREEVDALRAVHPGAVVLTPERSRAQDVVAALADADLAHLACHGSPRADNPMFSSLLLADGPVTLQELHGAGVAPHRLVLASCHSGADVAYAGDEVLGFVSAMLAQGTAGVVASIAAVPDVAAVDLMLGLHRGLRDGQTLAHALHAARGAVDRDSPEGFVNWCTFSAHGAA